MPYDKNEPEYTGGPKKADIIIKNTHDLAIRQEELSEQTRLAVAKIEEAIRLFSQGNQGSSGVADRSGEFFTQLQGENSALKQELLYLAKQSENIYAGLAEKITELSEQAKVRESAMNSFADRLNDVAEQAKKGEESYSIIADKLTELAEHGKRSTELYNGLSNRLDVISTFTSSGAYVPAAGRTESKVDLSEVLSKLDALSEKVEKVQVVGQPQPVVLQTTSQPANVDLSQVLERLDALADQIKKNERAYGELSDKVTERKPVSRNDYSGEDINEIFDKMNRISDQLRRSESAHSMLADKFEILSMRVEQYAYESNKGMPAYRQQPQVIATPPAVVKEEKEIDYDKLAQKVASLISAREVVSPDYIASKVAEQIIIPEVEAPNVNVSVDADYIASKVVEKIVVPEAKPVEVDVDYIAKQVAEQIVVPEAKPVEVDLDYIAKQVAEQIVIPEVKPAEVDADYIAKQVAELMEDYAGRDDIEQVPLLDEEVLSEKIAERVVELQPGLLRDDEDIVEKIAQRVAELKPVEEIQAPADIDSDELAEKIAQKLNLTEAQKELAPASAIEIDEEGLAEKLAGKLGVYTAQVLAPVVPAQASIDEESLAQRIAEKLGNVNLKSAPAYDVDEEELADAISIKVGSLKAEDFEILVDDEGCSSISKGIADNLDYNMISNIISDKLREALDLAAVNAPDYEEMAERISEKITVAGINEDAIADKAAAVLSNYLPEFDTDEIADKVTGAVIDVVSAIPTPTFDSEEICNTITERLIESQEDHDYDIVIDDDGIARITELVSEEINRDTGARFDKVEENIQKLSDIVSRIDENTTAEEQAEPEDDALADVVSRLDVIEENVTKLTELLTSEEVEEVEDGQYDEDEDDYDALSEVVTRLEVIEENITKLTELITSEEEVEEYAEEEDEVQTHTDEQEHTSPVLSDSVASEIEKVSTRLAGVEENVAKIAEFLAADEQQTEEEEPAETEETDEESEEQDEQDYTTLSEAVADEVEKRVSERLYGIEDNIAKLSELLTPAEEDEEEAGAEDEEEAEEVEDDYDALADVVSRLDGLQEDIAKLTELLTSEEQVEETEGEEVEEVEEVEDDYDALADVVSRLDGIEENITKLSELLTSEEYAEEVIEEDYTVISDAVASEVEKRVNVRLDNMQESISRITEVVRTGAEEAASEFSDTKLTNLSVIVATEVQRGINEKLDNIEASITILTQSINAEEEVPEYEEYEVLNEDEDHTGISQAIAQELAGRFESIEEGIAKINQTITEIQGDEDYTVLSTAVADEVERRVSPRFDTVEESVAKINEAVAPEEVEETEEEDYTALSTAVADEVEKRVNSRLEGLEENVAKINEAISAEPEYEEQEEEIVEEDYTALSTAVADEVEKRVNSRLEGLEENVAKINEAISAEPEYEEQEEEIVEEDYTALSTAVADEVEKRVNSRLDSVEEKISAMLANGIAAAEVAAAAQSAAAEEEFAEEEPLVTVSDIVEDIPEESEEETEEFQEVEEAAPLTKTAKAPLQSAAVKPAEEEFGEEEEEPDEEDFLIDVLDMDAFSDDELMPGEGSDYHDGVDFENMMKFKRSFIARIIQSNDEYKQYYGEVKHALLSYRKVNSNVAWGAERFNKGRETIARMKIRGKTLCLYLALDPNEYKTSVYHHFDVSDNKSVAGTPMMVKVKSNLGVKKAIRLIDEMLAKRNGEKKEIPERDYAAMYPYETIEELIDDGLVKDVRKK